MWRLRGNVFNRDRQLAVWKHKLEAQKQEEEENEEEVKEDEEEQKQEQEQEQEQLSFVENRPGFSPVLSQKPTRSCQKQQTKEEIQHKD